MSANNSREISDAIIHNGTDTSSNHSTSDRHVQRITIPSPESSKQCSQPSYGSEYFENSVDINEHPNAQGLYQVPETESVWSGSPREKTRQSPRTPTRDALAVDTLSSASSIRSLRNVSPGTRAKQYFEHLRGEQEVIPSNADPRRLPTRADFPLSISLKILQPIEDEDDHIEKVVIVLHDYTGTERSLDNLSRRLQKHFPESALLLLRGQEGVPSGNSGYHWADPGSGTDGSFVNACRLLLLDVVKNSLVAKCGFNARDIIILGHRQGGMVALAAAACWETVEFAGAVSVGGPIPNCAQLPSGMKAKTPVLVLGGVEGDINPAALRRMQMTFCHVTHDLRLTSQDTVPESRELVKPLLKPLLSFLAHRLRREEWTKQTILSLGELPLACDAR